jgi:hypothetical protein
VNKTAKNRRKVHQNYVYNGFQGLIDEVAYYDYAPSEEQIIAHLLLDYYPGDINYDGKVDFKDFTELGSGWLTIYDFDTLAEVVDYWLVEY